ncbi:MAG TPA: LLM class flavin-dependent oxidoreductase [Alphaproteobacteria bacterium]|nr:LLM class flavin-dependent oxidoreductase [Alphaproteobacteria bacterium]
MQFDLLTLGDHLPDPHTGEYNETQAERFAMWVEQGVLAERAGYGAYWIGEHHCSDYIVSSPQMLLAAIAVRTERIRLGSAVSLLPNNDPVRLAEDFATLDLLSNGRAEIGFGGGFTEHTFALFGQDIAKSAEMSRENLDLLPRIWTEDEVDWAGRFRAPIRNNRFQPRTFSGRPIPINRATATSLATAEDAGSRGHKLMCMTVAGSFTDAKPLAEAYRTAYRAAGHDPAGMNVAALAYVHVRPDGDQARAFWHPYRDNYRAFTKSLTERRGLSRGLKDLYARLGPEGLAVREGDFCGSPEEIIEMILRSHEAMGSYDKLICFSDCGGLSAADTAASVELFADAVMPAVRAALNSDAITSGAPGEALGQ